MKKPKSEKWYAAMEAKRGTTGRNQYSKAKELGLPAPTLTEESRKKMSEASSKKRHSEETKKKISQKRTQFLQENPHMVPYKLNHYSKGRSYPEEYWKEVLDAENLSYVEQFQIGLYQLDFAFPELKIDLEIDGDQHYLDEKIVQSDLRRTQYLEELGWKVIRIKWSAFKKLTNKREYIENVLKQLGW
jgi:very-short-patch-repair endonuclease